MTGEFLRKKVENAGFQSNALAELLGISPQNLNNKYNSSSIKVEFLVLVAKSINKSIYYFLEGYSLADEMLKSKIEVEKSEYVTIQDFNELKNSLEDQISELVKSVGLIEIEIDASKDKNKKTT